MKPTLLCALFSVMLVACAAPGIAGEPPPTLPPLTTVPHSPRLPGKFVWADLVTDDVAKAEVFYNRLFGWTFSNLDGYVVLANDERPLAGMVQRARPAEVGARPRWFGYISVPNIGRACQSVTNSGGKVIAAPKKLPNRGEQAILTDPEGALFGVIKSSAGDPQDFLPEPGDWIWIELLSRDARKAGEFYRTVAGYDVIENTKTNAVSDYVLSSAGYARATVLTIPPERTKVQPTWVPFVRVKSITASVSQATALGGRVIVSPRPDLLESRVAVIADPTGAAIGIMEWPDELPKGGPGL